MGAACAGWPPWCCPAPHCRGSCVLKASDSGVEERNSGRLLALRALDVAVAGMRGNDPVKNLPQEERELVKAGIKRLHAGLLDRNLTGGGADERRRGRELAVAVQTSALDAALPEVLTARNEAETDLEVADRILRQLDLRTMILPA